MAGGAARQGWAFGADVDQRHMLLQATIRQGEETSNPAAWRHAAASRQVHPCLPERLPPITQQQQQQRKPQPTLCSSKEMRSLHSGDTAGLSGKASGFFSTFSKVASRR